MDKRKIEKWGQQLDSNMLLFGKMIQRKACQKLAKDSSAQVVPYLAKALLSEDEQVRIKADSALRALSGKLAVDKLCETALNDISGQAAKICMETDKRPSDPVKMVSFLLKMSTSKDARIKSSADGALRALSGRRAVETLCDIALKDVSGQAARICMETDKRPSDPVKMVSFLLKMSTSKDARIKSSADGALRALSGRRAVETLCDIALKDVSGQAARICMETDKYPSDSKKRIQFLLEMYLSKERKIQSSAEKELESLSDENMVDELCDMAIQEPSGSAAKVCVKTGKCPSDEERACLFLFVTRQLDKYFEEDFEFQNLRLQYERADEKVKGNVMEIVRSGDRRCLGFIMDSKAKPLSECTENEITLAIESGLKNRDWKRLFRAVMDIPLKYGFPLLESFDKSGWEPEGAEQKSLYKSIIEESHKSKSDFKAKRDETSPIFEQWLTDGETGELSKLSEAELLKRLEGIENPEEGVKIVAALSLIAEPDGATAEKIRTSEHWMVRLAGYSTGLCYSLKFDEVEDDNYWVTNLVKSSGVLEFYPSKATPDDLEKLRSAPREAWAGKLGSARRILETIMAHRIDVGTYEEMIVEAGEFAGEFEED